MGFSNTIKEDILVKSARHCCVCRQHAGRNVEVHHIIPKGEGGEDTFENAIPLCFNCHSEAGHYNPQHPKGTKFSRPELRKHKEEWFKNVAENKIQMPTLPKPESLDDLINLKISNVDNSKKIDSPEGLVLMKKETDFIKRRIKEFEKKVKPKYRQLEFRNIENVICDLRGYGYTLLMQFYTDNQYSAKISILTFSLYRNYFSEKGQLIGDPNREELKDRIKYTFSFNENNEFGWRIEGRKNPFYSSEKLIEDWIKKYMKYALEESNVKRYVING